MLSWATVVNIQVKEYILKVYIGQNKKYVGIIIVGHLSGSLKIAPTKVLHLPKRILIRLPKMYFYPGAKASL